MTAIRKRVLTLPAALLVAGALGAPAQAQESVAPPGNSGIDEYRETFPGPTGDRPSSGGSGSGGEPGGRGSSGGGAGGSVLPRDVQRRLRREGGDGQAVQSLANRTAPESAAGGSSGRSSGNGSGAGSSDRGGVAGSTASGETGGKSLPAQVVEAAKGSDGGMGFVFPMILGGALAGAAALGIARRRRTA